jgi:hypothetical protein
VANLCMTLSKLLQVVVEAVPWQQSGLSVGAFSDLVHLVHERSMLVCVLCMRTECFLSTSFCHLYGTTTCLSFTLHVPHQYQPLDNACSSCVVVA